MVLQETYFRKNNISLVGSGGSYRHTLVRVLRKRHISRIQPENCRILVQTGQRG